jgi:hypothetical protein
LRAVAEVGAQLNDRLDAVQQIARTFPSDPRVSPHSGKAFTPGACGVTVGTPDDAGTLDDAADAFDRWCKLRQWGTFVNSQWWAAESGSLEESRLDEVSLLIDEHIASTETAIAAQAANAHYCGAYARLRDFFGPYVERAVETGEESTVSNSLFEQCETVVRATDLLPLLRTYYGSMDYASMEIEHRAYPEVGAFGSEPYDLPAAVELDIAIVETAYLAAVPAAAACLSRSGSTLDAVGLGTATVAQIDAVWDELRACPADTAPAPGNDALKRWHGVADTAYWEAAVGSDIERAYLELSNLLQMLLRRQAPLAALPEASFEEMESALEEYPTSGTPEERVAALAEAVTALERGIESLGMGCRGASGYCSHTFDKYVARGQMIAQLKTTDWFRNLAAGQGDFECPTSTGPRQTFRRLDADGNAALYYSTLAVETAREPTVLATVCPVPEPSGFSAVPVAAAPVDELPEGKRVDETSSMKPEVMISVPLRDLVESRRIESGLDGILLADCRGEVLFADTVRQLSVLGIRGLIDTSLAAADAECIGPGQSWTRSVSIAGVPMRVFGHPYEPAGVVVSAVTAGDDAAGDDADGSDAGDGNADPQGNGARAVTWYVIGLQSETSFQRKARVLPFEVIVVVAPLVAVAVLAWPFLILVLSGAGARFGQGAPLSFTASAVGGAGVLTIIGFGLVHHGATVELRNQLLWRVADDMQTAFAT